VNEYLKLLDDFKSNGGCFLGIPGNGEPFHPGNRELVIQILQHADSLGLRTTVFTTGESLFWDMRTYNNYKVNVAAEPDFSLMDELIKLDVIFLIKCNSLIPETQDRLVAQVGYTQARQKAMQWLMNKYHLNADPQNRRLGIVTSIMPENQDEIVTLYRYAEDNNLIFDCDTILPRGRGKSFIKQGHSLSDQKCRAIYRSLDQISDEPLTTGGSYVGVACDRIKHHLYIDIQGNAYTCIGCVGRGNELVLGNVRTHSMQQIWDHTIRVQMRENLDKVVIGPCSYCENFQVSCWSCLGRSVEHFEVKEGKLFLHTRGCFNHKPDWDRWLTQCDRMTRTLISEYPAAFRKQVRDRIHRDGLEMFWCELPDKMIDESRKRRLPAGRKDICFSDLNFPSRMVWDFTSIHETENIDDYLKAVGTLLPRVLLCSLKLISERSIVGDRERPFVPLTDDNGVVQFTNLMFYLPQKNRYMYRTIVQNMLDPGILDLDEHRFFIKDHPIEHDRILNEIRISSRMGRLWQRWAEAFSDGKVALILPHIKNLSRELEGENIETYELILTEKLYQNERLWIHTDILRNELDVLAIFPLLDTPIIKDRVAPMHEIVRRIAEDEQVWKELYSIITDQVWAQSWGTFSEKLAQLEATYRSIASAGFYPVKPDQIPETQRGELEAQLRGALSEIIRVNIHLFPDSDESNWFKEPLKPILDKDAWADLISTIGGAGRTKNRQEKRLPRFLHTTEFADHEVLSARLYNPLLLQMIRLFIDEQNEDGSLNADWPMAANYFIWLSFFREYLNIQTYFVHHAHNLRRLLDVFIANKEVSSTPSGIIVCTHERLSSQTKSDYKRVFTQTMNPLEELIQAEFLSTDMVSSESKLTEAHRIADARKMALGHYGHTLKNRLDVLNAFLDQHGTPEIHLRKEMLRDLTLILQLNTLDNRKELLEHLPSRKQERFLDIEGHSGIEERVDLVQRIQDWKELVCGLSDTRIDDPDHGIHEDRHCRFELDIDSALRHAFIDLHLMAETPTGRKRARLKEAVYRELIFELLNNAMRYGVREATYDPGAPGGYHVCVGVHLCHNVISYGGEEKPMFVICNEVNNEKAQSSQIILDAMQHKGWHRWPESKKYDGPGMSVDLLRRLNLGDMFYEVEDAGRLIFRVGLYLEGVKLG